MDEPDPLEPEPVVISRRAVDSLAMATLLAACLATGIAVVVIFARDFTAEPSVISALFLGLGIPVLLGANLYVAVYWSRVASRAEIGDDISLRTLCGHRRYSWEDLGRLVVFEQAFRSWAAASSRWCSPMAVGTSSSPIGSKGRPYQSAQRQQPTPVTTRKTAVKRAVTIRHRHFGEARRKENEGDDPSRRQSSPDSRE